MSNNANNGKGYFVTKEHWSKPNNPISLDPVEVMVPSDVESRNSGGTSKVLENERKKATFNIEKMTNFLDGGVERTKRRRFIISPTIGMDMSDKYYWDRKKLLNKHVEHQVKVHKPFLGKLFPTRDDVLWMTENAMISGAISNHFGLFLPTIMGMASEKQKAKWLLRIVKMQIIGCYCIIIYNFLGQTELGHGSNVRLNLRGLQTTATFDSETDEFILDTPTLQSTKWWPGALGKISTHAAVYAQLIIDGKEYGVHVFMLQIRDENHRPFKGIEIGDLGPKLGDGANDTGFMRLNKVRIPREDMFSGLIN